MITPLDQYDLSAMDGPQLEGVIKDLQEEMEQMEWEVDWRRRELKTLQASIARVQVLRWKITS